MSEDILAEFEAPADALNDAEVLFAEYEREGYEGEAFVLFRKDGKLFEVNGSHCSCYGLEGQWDPEETSVAALQKSVYGLRRGAAYKLFPLPADQYDVDGRLKTAEPKV